MAPRPRHDAPARPRRQSRPTLDRLEDRLQPNNLGGAWADLALGLPWAARARAAEVVAAPGRHTGSAPVRPATPAQHRLVAAAESRSVSFTTGTATASQVALPAAAAPNPTALPPAWFATPPSAPSTAPVAVTTPASRPVTAPTGSGSTTMTATATTPAPKVTVSSNFTGDGGYTLSQWGADGSMTKGIALWTVPGTATQEIVTVGSVDGTSNRSDEVGVARYRTDGTFDAGYGAGGVAANATGGLQSDGQALALKPDGTVVATGGVAGAGNAGANLLTARFTPTGAADPTFNGAGWASMSLPNSTQGGYGVGIQSNGKVIAAGYTDYAYTAWHPLVMRDTAAGKLDAGAGGFGQTGSNGTPVGYDAFPPGQYPNSQIYALAVQPDDKVVTVGRTYDANLYQAQVTLSRLNPDGTPDPTFNGGKTVLFPQSSLPWAEGIRVALQPDGKIVVGGYVAVGSATGRNPAGLLVARFNPDGSLDPTFNNGAGSIRVDVPGLSVGTYNGGVAIDGVGRIVVGACWAQSVNGATTCGVATLRLNPDGTPDATFGSGGVKSEAIPGTKSVTVTGVAVAADGSYYLAGTATPTSGVTQTLLVHDLP